MKACGPLGDSVIDLLLPYNNPSHEIIEFVLNSGVTIDQELASRVWLSPSASSTQLKRVLEAVPLRFDCSPTIFLNFNQFSGQGCLRNGSIGFPSLLVEISDCSSAGGPAQGLYSTRRYACLSQASQDSDLLKLYRFHEMGSAPLVQVFLAHAPEPSPASVDALLYNRGRTWDCCQYFQLCVSSTRT